MQGVSRKLVLFIYLVLVHMMIFYLTSWKSPAIRLVCIVIFMSGKKISDLQSYKV